MDRHGEALMTNVRYWRKADIGLIRGERPHLTQSGHLGPVQQISTELMLSELLPSESEWDLIQRVLQLPLCNRKED